MHELRLFTAAKCIGPVHMPCTFFIASSHQDTNDLVTLAQAITNAWPDRREPVSHELASLSSLLDSTTTMLTSAQHPHLIIIEPDEPRHIVRQVIDVIKQSCIPSLVLIPDTLNKNSLCGQGVLIESRNAPVGLLASMLYTLDQRQPALDELQSELKILSAYRGNMSSEMNKIHDELQLASTIQNEFLPTQLPELEAWDLGVLFRPAGYVSGDIYDIRKLNDRYLSFFLADAVGHGVPAALLTIVIAQSIRLSHEQSGNAPFTPPELVMQQLNKHMLCRQSTTARFATAIYGILDTFTGQVQMVNAGHPPPILVTGPVIQRFDSTAPLLGVFATDDFEAVHFTINPEQTLLIYSDGFELAFPRDDAPINDTYIEKLSTLGRSLHNSQTTSSKALEQLALDLDTQAGSLHQADDLTAIAISGLKPAIARINAA